MAATTANYSFAAPKEPLSAADFVFSGQKRQESAVEMTDEQIDAVFAAAAVPAV